MRVQQSTRPRRAIEQFSRNLQYDRLMKTLESSLRFGASDPARFKLLVLEHYYKYGWRSACDAFKVGKSTLYEWKKGFEQSGKTLISLVPKSTRPKHYRQSLVDYRLIELIKALREKRHNISKYKLKPFVDTYAEYLGVPSMSVSAIGKVIKKKHIFFPIPGVAKTVRKNKYARGRTNKSPKVRKPGYIEVDSVVIYLEGKRHCFICVIDIFTKFAHVKQVAHLSSTQALRALKEFQQYYGRPIHTVQTDNGSEFLKAFHAYLEAEHIRHQFIYPRCPRINGVVERFNRTIQEECINRNLDIVYDTKQFNKELSEYLSWYNYRRPHAALNYLSPVNFVQTYFPECG